MTDETSTIKPPRLRPEAKPELETAIRDFEAAENLAASLAEQAAEARANAKYIGETVLVALVGPDELNEGVRLSDGAEYTFEQKLKCSVAEGMKTDAYQYLEEKKAGGLLRRYLTLDFGRDSVEQVKMIRTMLARVLPSFEIGVKVGNAPASLRAAVEAIIKESGLNIVVTETLELPGATMAAFVRKELKAGREVPPAFGVYNPMRPIAAAPLPPEEEERQSAELIEKLQGSLKLPEEQRRELVEGTWPGADPEGGAR